LKAGSYGGTISITRALVDGVDTPVELGFANGTPADLAKMGLKLAPICRAPPAKIYWSL